jgi:transketolase
MFGKKASLGAPLNKAPSSKGGNQTVVGPGTRYLGDIHSQGDVRIEGTCEGKIKVAGKLLISEGAKVIAQIDGADVTIGGKVEGKVSGDRLRVLRSGKVWGDLAVGSLVVDDGAYLLGQVKMRGEAESPTAEISKSRTGPQRAKMNTELDKLLEMFHKVLDDEKRAETEWSQLLSRYEEAHPEEAVLLETLWTGKLPEGWMDTLPTFALTDGPLTTCEASNAVLKAIVAALPVLAGSSTDPSISSDTRPSAVLDGMALHGGLIPYAFSGYVRAPVRLAALEGLPIVYTWDCDPVWDGKGDSTRQSIEQLAVLRAIPNLVVIRPADANETVAAWYVALERQNGPTVLILTRQRVPILSETRRGPASTVARGAYILAESSGVPSLILVATGPEVNLAMEARDLLAGKGVAVRVVSLPSWELFDAQPVEYRESVLPPRVTARLAVEAGVSTGWAKYVGPKGDVVCLDHFDASVSGEMLMEKQRFTAGAIAERAMKLL